MRGLHVHKNIPVSVTKLILSLWIGFISSHLIVDKLFPVNPRAITGLPKISLLLEAKSMPAFIIKPRLILVSYTDDLCWYITSNQQGKMFVQTSTGLSEDQVTPRQFPNCTTDSSPIDLMFQENFITHTQVWNFLKNRNDCRIDLMFQENFPTHTQVWNCLSHRNDWQDREKWSELPIGATTATRTKCAYVNVQPACTLTYLGKILSMIAHIHLTYSSTYP